MTSKIHTTISVTTQLELTESEVLALDAIFGYNVDAFLKAFYRNLGRAYVEPHVAGVRSLHSHLRSTLAPAIRKIGEVRRGLI